MKRLPLRFLFVLTALGAWRAVAAPPPGYTLTWADEFNGNKLDLSQWGCRTDSKHWSTQLPANVSVHDGYLWLALKKEKSRGMEYTGAGIISKADFLYGYYEARFKIPPGKGWHTSFWLMKHRGTGDTAPDTAPQELDICESDSIHPLKYTANTHRWLPQPHVLVASRAVNTPNLSEGFHVWGCEFTPEKVVYFFDGKAAPEVDATRLPQQSRMNVWLTCIASYGAHTDAVDDSQLPAAAVFDYVRFYAKK